MTMPILHPGLFYLGTTAAGDTVRLWAAARAGHWHAAYNIGQRITMEPILADAIPALLAEWDVEPVAWISWAIPRAQSADLRLRAVREDWIVKLPHMRVRRRRTLAPTPGDGDAALPGGAGL